MEIEDYKSYLSQRIVEFIENVFLVEDFALVSVFIVVVYLLTHISW